MKISSVYVHVPFCEAKCPYCAFASALKQEGDEEIYLNAIKKEMFKEMFIERGQGDCVPLRGVGQRPTLLTTLYIGGGTPTILSTNAWRALIEAIERAFTFAPDAEVTVEANPGSLSAEHLRIWRGWRVTRVSVGAQSFDDAELALLGRVHTRAQAIAAAEACRAAEFDLSLDLMFGLPGQTEREGLRGWARSLRTALALAPHHLSLYQLSVEPDTPFARENFNLPDGYALYRYAQWLLPRRGYEQYEVASFALPGHESRHNLNYWADGDYLGLGPAAWSCTGGTRRKNAPLLSDYARLMEERGDAAVYSERLEGEPAARQAAVLALRTRGGIQWEGFAKRYGAEIADTIKDELAEFPGDLVRRDELGASLTPKGFRVGNRIWAEVV